MFERRSVKNCGKETVLSVTQDVGVVPRDSLDRKINMTDSNTDTYKLVEPGDFVISLRSFQGGIEYSKHRGIVSPAYHVIRPTVKVDNDFYRHYFKSYEFVGHLAIAVIGIRDGKQISYDDFAYMRFPYPPVPEQTRIASVLSTCDREIELLLRKEIVLREQKKGLMQKLLTGEIRVKVQENNG
jgi:type I restriction enzyme S subunit